MAAMHSSLRCFHLRLFLPLLALAVALAAEPRDVRLETARRGGLAHGASIAVVAVVALVVALPLVVLTTSRPVWTGHGQRPIMRFVIHSSKGILLAMNL